MPHKTRMKQKPKTAPPQSYKSEALAAIHMTVSDYHAAGAVNKQTMRRFDDACLTPIHPFTGAEIQALRDREEVSQTVLARHLNVSKDTISQWERGKKRPMGASLKLLAIVEKKGLAAIV
jgi:putative transcriptional regulator